MTKALVQYMRHVAHSSSLYPIGTFWLIACVVVPLGIAAGTGPWPMVVALTVVAGVLTLAASLRDDRRETALLRTEVGHVASTVDAQREALEARIMVLTEALRAAGVPIPSDPTARRT